MVYCCKLWTAYFWKCPESIFKVYKSCYFSINTSAVLCKKSCSWKNCNERPIEMEKNSWELGLETWTLVRKYTHIWGSENIPFSTRTSLVLVMSGDHESEVWLPDCSKLAIFWKVTMTSLFADKTSSSSFLDVAVFLLSSLVTGPSFMSISLLVLELWQFFCKGLIRNPKLGNTTDRVWSNISRLGWVRDQKFRIMFLMKSYLMLQIARFTAFTISELLRETKRGDKIPSPSPRLALKCPDILKRVEVNNANPQHKQIFVKYLFRDQFSNSSNILTHWVLEFRGRFLVF